MERSFFPKTLEFVIGRWIRRAIWIAAGIRCFLAFLSFSCVVAFGCGGFSRWFWRSKRIDIEQGGAAQMSQWATSAEPKQLKLQSARTRLRLKNNFKKEREKKLNEKLRKKIFEEEKDVELRGGSSGKRQIRRKSDSENHFRRHLRRSNRSFEPKSNFQSRLSSSKGTLALKNCRFQPFFQPERRQSGLLRQLRNQRRELSPLFRAEIYLSQPKNNHRRSFIDWRRD